VARPGHYSSVRGAPPAFSDRRVKESPVLEVPMLFSPRQRPKGFQLLTLAGTFALGCSGSITSERPSTDDSPGVKPDDMKTPDKKPPPGDKNPPPDDMKPPVVVAPGGVTAGVAPLRRLNADQYRNTIKDLFGFNDGLTGDALPADEAVSDERFVSNISRLVQSADFDKYGNAANAIATKAVANLPGLLGSCAATDMTCVSGFITNFGKRVYRRPLSQTEKDRALTLFNVGKTTGDATNGIRLVLEAMLQSTNFLYLFELASPSDAGKIVQVDNWAMASRLSYFLTGTMPDAPLFAAAESGALSSAEQVAAQAKRLMAKPQFLAMVESFHKAWLQLGELASLEKDATMFPAATWNEPLRAALIDESRRFVDEVMQGDGSVNTLLTASFSMVNGPLATFYGMSGGPTGDTWQKMNLDGKQRTGLLTQGGLMATLAHEDRTSYILRGKLIREGVLCTKIGDPPAGVDTNETKIPPGSDARTRSMLHRDKPSCKVCHDQFDPLGFAFENYDAVGRYRTTENGAAIDTHGDLTGTDKIDGAFTNAVDLIGKLAAADEVKHCLALQWTRFALGRDIPYDKDSAPEPEAAADLASVDQSMAGFKANGWKLADLVAAIAVTDSFRYQKVKP
jgi:hypothetical protein